MPTDSRPVKVPTKSYERLKTLVAFTARNGWAALGIDRDDPPTQAALLEEAIDLLDARKNAAKGKARR